MTDPLPSILARLNTLSLRGEVVALNPAPPGLSWREEDEAYRRLERMGFAVTRTGYGTVAVGWGQMEARNQ